MVQEKEKETKNETKASKVQEEFSKKLTSHKKKAVDEDLVSESEIEEGSSEGQESEVEG